MAPKLRASISVSATLFKLLKAEAKRRDIPIGQLVELAVGPELGLEPAAAEHSVDSLNDGDPTEH